MNIASTHSFLQDMSPYSGKGSTDKVVELDKELVEATKAHIRATGFKPIICLLSERFASIILVQCLVEIWWDTTHAL